MKFDNDTAVVAVLMESDPLGDNDKEKDGTGDNEVEFNKDDVPVMFLLAVTPDVTLNILEKAIVRPS